MLLLGIEARGPDATGFAFRDSVGEFQIHKAPLTAKDFVPRRLCMPRAARTAILHTRFATQGHQSYNVNNHPILSGPIVGVHNGMIANDWSIFNELGKDKRVGEVDSEAIFALMAFGNIDYMTALERVRGSMTVAWMNLIDPTNTLHLARGSMNPLFIAQTANDSVVFGSTKSAVMDACEAVGLKVDKLREPEEGQYHLIREGTVLDVKSFTPQSGHSWSRGYTRSGMGGWDTYEEFDWNPPARVTERAGKVIDLATRTVSLLDEGRDPLAPVTKPTTPFDPTTRFWLTENAWQFEYSDRIEAISAHYLEVSKQQLDKEETQKEVDHIIYGLHSTARPGDEVETFLGEQLLKGEIITVPKSWPEGKYHIRVRVPLYDEDGAPYEFAIVEREAHEFSTVTQR